MNAQFRTLVAHFFRRCFDVDSTLTDADGRTRIIQWLVLLSIPGLMVPFFMGGGRYVFVTYSMTATGLLMAFKWDSLFPDSRDYQILMSLPISLRQWFLAKVLALAAFLALFVIAINFFPTVMIPPAVGSQSGSWTMFVRAFIAHTAGTIGGSIFAALFFAALQGVLINVLSWNTFKRISPHIQMVSIAILVTVMLVIPLIGASIRVLAQRGRSVLDYFPLIWFLGLYDALIPGGPSIPRSTVWAWTAVYGTAVVTLVFGLTYFIGYRRYAKKILENIESETVVLRWVKKAADTILDRTLLRHPVQRGTFHFIEKISSRSAKHRILTALHLAVGVALAVSSLFVLDRESQAAMPFRLSMRGALEAPPILVFLLISGLRATFNVPFELNANWMFQTTGDGGSPHFLKALRKWVFCYRIIPLFCFVAVFEFLAFPKTVALLHLSFDLIVAALLIEVLFFKFNKVPFTCSYSSTKLQLGLIGAAYLYGFSFYVLISTALKRAVASSAARMGVFFVVAVLIFAVFQKLRRREEIIFKDDEPGLLSLSADDGYWRSVRS